ncbi:MAG: phenylalanine--tRNA ligase subunit alpha [Opitutaceae bacterium]|jgi:phenylalanyl-tRNA synthetase alpha chain|nr:phenylalanine--tRNA ligase subunit alpha [Opitutaceae bacterium]
MKARLAEILQQAAAELPAVHSRPEFEAAKARFVGPNGALTACMKQMASVPKADKPALGKLINDAKTALAALLDAARERLDAAELAAALGKPVDPTLPSPDTPNGSLHPLTQTRDLITGTFKKLGFAIADGPELESEWFCFDALNMPDDHPARDMQDTLFLPPDARSSTTRRGNEAYVLRTHTSSVQIRVMLARKPPIRILSPGRAFRRDTTDATHSANFHQVEGLWVDRNVTVRDLKSILDAFVRELFGDSVRTRLRPSYFPFTEPSFELDIKAANMGRLSDRWIELGGCGLVNPRVFENVGINPGEWTGLAFGMGLERVAMLLHGIDDIRHFYANDLRFLRQFA